MQLVALNGSLAGATYDLSPGLLIQSADDGTTGPQCGCRILALSEGEFALEFERAKGSQELANELHRAKLAEATERQQLVDTLKKYHAPPAEILEARRDRAVSNAQLTAAAFLAVERWRGRNVSEMDPRGIVGDVIRTQREHLTEERDEEKPTAQAGRIAEDEAVKRLADEESKHSA